MRITILKFIWIFLIIILFPYIEAKANIYTISAKECEYMHSTEVITNSNPIGCDRLRRVSFKHLNFEDKIIEGNVVVLDIVAEHTAAIFSELLERNFPIYKAVLMQNYEGNDKLSMNDNNSSAFNGRPITGGNSWSKHAYGVAIDINPLQNPYISFQKNGFAEILPAASSEFFVNRSNTRPNKKLRTGMAETVVDIFARHGFMRWGGEWDSPIDYQHFEIGSQDFVETLLSQSQESARQTFNLYAKDYNDCLLAHKEQSDAETQRVCIEKVRK